MSNAFDTSGPSQTAQSFYTPGYSPPRSTRVKAVEEKKKARQIDVAALRAYRADNKTLEQCANEFGCERGLVSKLLAEPKGTRVKGCVFDKGEALAMFMDGQSLKAIGRHFGISRDPIRQFINHLGLDAETRARVAIRVKERRTPLLERRTGMTAKQCETFDRLGGVKWLRALLDANEVQPLR